MGKKKYDGFVIVTQDNAGFGFAKILADQGTKVILAKKPEEIYEKDEEKAALEMEKFWLCGDGIAPILELEKAIKDPKLKSWGWIFDGNHNSDIADKLRARGYDVWGTYGLTHKMENDREFGVSLVKKAGLETPPTFECKTIEDGIKIMQENPDKKYVFKPDEPDSEAWVTTMPSSEEPEQANAEMQRVLISFGEAKSPFILQEIKEGVELNVEFFMYEGTPYFAHANLECKRKYDHDLGRMIGCAQDIEFVIPMDAKILKDTLWKLVKLPEFRHYTGPLDLNLIAADRSYYFLEFCARFGYNAHPNLFVNLAMSPLEEIFSDMLSGNVSGFKEHFRRGFGASVVMWIDTPVKGLPIEIPKEVEKDFYPFDLYREDDEYHLAGYGNEVGIICGHSYEIKSAADETLKNFHKIFFPGKAGRTDLAKDDYPSNPVERWIAANNAMHLFEKEV